MKLQLYSNTSAYTLAALPAGMFRGQMLVMFTLATTNQTITIPNDPAKKILTATGTDVVLTGTSRPISFIWNGANWCRSERERGARSASGGGSGAANPTVETSVDPHPGTRDFVPSVTPARNRHDERW
ncbi:hypothetical protein GS988_02480 [Rhodococcus hoagii]|nr:hypothetical protein [Prescottella equi]